MTFEELYQSHYERIYKFCFRFVDNTEKAGDFTQDTFLKLYQRMNSRQRTIENPKAWLYKVAGNICLNAVNTENRREQIMDGLDLAKAEYINPENLLLQEEMAGFIRKALDQLRPEHQLLLLMYQDGLSYKEMSEATGIPLSSIGKTLWRGIEKVSDLLKKVDHE